MRATSCARENTRPMKSETRIARIAQLEEEHLTLLDIRGKSTAQINRMDTVRKMLKRHRALTGVRPGEVLIAMTPGGMLQ